MAHGRCRKGLFTRYIAPGVCYPAQSCFANGSCLIRLTTSLRLITRKEMWAQTPRRCASTLTPTSRSQITGTGDFTKINIAAGDAGGELDPHGATGNGNPIGEL